MSVIRIIRTLVIGVIVSSGCFNAYAQAQTSPQPKNGSDDPSYDAMLAKLKAGITDIDFKALRIAYSRTARAISSGTPHEIRRKMNGASQQSLCTEAVKIADEIQQTNYLSPDTHIVKSTCFRQMGDITKADFHKAVYLGLINSILASGDGTTFEKAYQVISIEEEYAVMRALSLTVWDQEQGRSGEHYFEILSGSNDKTGQSTKVYFNIDIPVSLERGSNKR